MGEDRGYPIWHYTAAACMLLAFALTLPSPWGFVMAGAALIILLRGQTLYYRRRRSAR